MRRLLIFGAVASTSFLDSTFCVTTGSASGLFDRVTRVVVVFGSTGAANISFLICGVDYFVFIIFFIDFVPQPEF